ncbi:MAG: hypothetical protein JSV25_10330 [Spirochaetota bacterium]|nr:MAG: hypothetical protein JSV25_10330 [Spirochaetota bacterium]
MQTKLIIMVISIVFTLSPFLGFSDSKLVRNGSCEGGSCSVTVSGKGHPGGSDNPGKNQPPSLFYQTKEGNLYLWHHSYNHRLRSYEGNGNEESLNLCLYDIANRYRLGDRSNVEDFVKWALRKRPWNDK